MTPFVHMKIEVVEDEVVARLAPRSFVERRSFVRSFVEHVHGGFQLLRRVKMGRAKLVRRHTGLQAWRGTVYSEVLTEGTSPMPEPRPNQPFRRV